MISKVQTQISLTSRSILVPCKISLLESHSSTYTAHISVLQNRLLAAFDTLDSTQNVHAQELAALKEQMARLKEQLDHYVYLFKDVETERDDMRDAIMQLVEKGGDQPWLGDSASRNHVAHHFAFSSPS